MIASQLRDRFLRRPVQERAALYADPPDARAIASRQLQMWNREWSRILREVPFYATLQKQIGLPDRFNSWDQFVRHVPVTTRSQVQTARAERRSALAPPNHWRITGGSTAQPLQMPAWNSEFDHTRPDTWLGRYWYGVLPADRQFTIWGHSHLLGTGLRGFLNARKRELFDRLLSYRRFSAYDLGFENMRRAAHALLRFSPRYLVGYSVALDAFARANRDLAAPLRALGLKVVIGAAERFPFADSERLLSDLFGCQVAMEYGSVETGLIAHTAPAGGYQTFWNTYFVEAEPAGADRAAAIRVTSLYPRCFPLVRYELGDEIELEDDCPHPILRFRRVIGRCNDYLLLPTGEHIHSEAITHAVRSFGDVTGYQVIQQPSQIRLYLTAPNQLPAECIAEIQRRLKVVHPLLAEVTIQQCGHLQHTIVGKHPMVIRER
jgi:phenylacetate-CoA ligase